MSNVNRYNLVNMFRKALLDLGFKDKVKEVNQNLRYLIIFQGFEPKEDQIKRYQASHYRLIKINPACEKSFKEAALKLAGIYRNFYRYKRKNTIEADAYSAIVYSLLRTNKHLSLEGEIQDQDE